MGRLAVATRGEVGSIPTVPSMPPYPLHLLSAWNGNWKHAGSTPAGGATYHVRYQEHPWSCGPSALVNAARALGKRISEKRVRSLAGCTEAGTDESGLIHAARGLGLTATPHHSADSATAWAFVRSNVLEGRPCLICVDSWGHWVTVVGIVGDRVIVADPANTKVNKAENGVELFTRPQLLKRWRCPNEAEPFYALAVGR